MSGRPLVIAHRGASGYRPEHSFSSYELAISQGADAIEPDVVVSKDGVLVVRHDVELSASTDVSKRVEFGDRYTSKVVDGHVLTGWFVEDFTWAELSTLTCVEPNPLVRPDSAAFGRTENILRLDDVLGLAAKSSKKPAIVIEIKHPTYFQSLGFAVDELVAAAIAASPFKRNDPRLIMESFEKSILIKLRTAGVGGSHVYLCEQDGGAYDELQRLGGGLSYRDELAPSGLISVAKEVDAISIDVAFLLSPDGNGPAVVRRAHDLGLKVYVWTLRPENKFLPREYAEGFDPKNWGRWREHFSRILDVGIDGIFVDHPDIALTLIAERGQ